MKSFPKIWALGSRQIPDILNGEVEVTEKMDGSQFGFGKTPEGELRIRSKGQWIDPEVPPALFRLAVEHVLSVQDLINPNSFYYGEAITSTRHNTLRYDHTPKGYITLFGAGDYEFCEVVTKHEALTAIADVLGVDVVPLVHAGEIDADDISEFLGSESYLGGPEMEGVVVKRYVPYELFGQFVPVQCGKFVSEAFKEKHKVNPDYTSGKSKMQMYFQSFRTESRWHKAVQHLRDNDQLIGEPKDIGPLLKELNQDLEAEWKEEIKEKLWQIHKKDVFREVTSGFPQWYKEQLLSNLS